jgi:predicted DNA-binding transcriptional regulator AlpA
MGLREHEVAERRRVRRKHKQPSQAEAERRRQQSARDLALPGIGHNKGPSLATPTLAFAHADRVLSFAQWCAVNGFSKATGRRVLKSGRGPPVLQLSPRRIGIRESANADWQASRVRGA